MDCSNPKNNLQVCRLCLAQTFSQFSLIENDENTTMLKELTSMIISPTDAISTVMCLKCKLNLKLAFRIQQKMLKVEEEFRKRIKARNLQKAQPVIEIEDEVPSTIMPIGAPPCGTEKRYACPVCRKGYKGAAQRNEHVKSAHAHSPPSCLTVLDEHARLSVSEVSQKTYTCDVCGKAKSSESQLSTHKRLVHRSKAQCPTCKKWFSHGYMPQHMHDHKVDNVICHLCGKTFKTATINHHIRWHGNQGHRCQFCAKLYKSKICKDMHEKKEHGGSPDIMCEQCGKKFFTHACLKRHVRGRHEKLRPFICEFCKKGFSSSFSLRTHRRQHTDETPYRCEVCGEGFRQNVSLRAHKRSKHDFEEEMTEECKLCGKKFASKAAVDAHSRVH